MSNTPPNMGGVCFGKCQQNPPLEPAKPHFDFRTRQDVAEQEFNPPESSKRVSYGFNDLERILCGSVSVISPSLSDLLEMCRHLHSDCPFIPFIHTTYGVASLGRH